MGGRLLEGPTMVGRTSDWKEEGDVHRAVVEASRRVTDLGRRRQHRERDTGAIEGHAPL